MSTEKCPRCGSVDLVGRNIKNGKAMCHGCLAEWVPQPKLHPELHESEMTAPFRSGKP